MNLDSQLIKLITTLAHGYRFLQACSLARMSTASGQYQLRKVQHLGVDSSTATAFAFETGLMTPDWTHDALASRAQVVLSLAYPGQPPVEFGGTRRTRRNWPVNFEDCMRLKTRHQQSLLLRGLGCNVQQVADALEISEGTIKSHFAKLSRDLKVPTAAFGTLIYDLGLIVPRWLTREIQLAPVGGVRS